MTLAMYPLARLARLLRSSLADVLDQDYIRAARARGVRDSVVLVRHALKNASLPVVTVAALQFGHLLGGAVITETIFGWPGIGHYTVVAIHERDFPVVQAAVFLSSGVFIAMNLVVDLLYGWLDPRIRYS
jgi:peptide/nickel transport system permease protein